MEILPPGPRILVDPGIIFDKYITTGADRQAHTIRDVSTTVDIRNDSASPVFLFTVDPYGTETPLGSLPPGMHHTTMDLQGALKPSTMWRIKDAAGNILKTYVTTETNYQVVEIPAGIIPVVSDLIGDIQSQPGVVFPEPDVPISGGRIENPSIRDNFSIPPELTNQYTFEDLDNSIFNFTPKTINWDVLNLELSIRRRLPTSISTDKHQIRTAVYAALIAIAKVAKKDRTPSEQAVMNWLAGQVKQTRIAAAQLALDEHDRWDRDPWGYRRALSIIL